MRKSIVVIAAAVGLAAATSAFAADHTATLSSTAPSFAWNGGPGTAYVVPLPADQGNITTGEFVGCHDDLSKCEDVLLKIETAAKLTVTVNADDDSTDAVDVYLYKSNEAGEYEDGEFLTADDEDISDAQGATEASDEKISMDVEPGYYVAQVRFYDASDDTYKGTATLSGFPTPVAEAPPAPVTAEAPPAQAPPPAAAPAPAPQSQPAAQPAPKKASRKSRCMKKAKKIKNKGKRKKALKKCRKLKR